MSKKMPAQLAAIARQFILPLRTTFSSSAATAFYNACARVSRKNAEAIMDEVTELSHDVAFNEDYKMARAKKVEEVEKVEATARAGRRAAKQSAAEQSTVDPDTNVSVPEKASRQRAPKHDPAAKLVWLVKENPKRPGSASAVRFDGYFKAKTVGAYLEQGGTTGDLNYDMAHGFVEFA